MKTKISGLGTIFFLVHLAGYAHAAVQPVVANIAFDSPLTITKNSDIDFGLVAAAHAATYVISPQGTVLASNGGSVLGGMQRAASLTIMGSPTQAIDIQVNNYVASAGVTPSAAKCLYNGGSPAACALTTQAAPGSGKILLIGATVNVDGSQKPGTSAAPTFDVVVNYH